MQLELCATSELTHFYSRCLPDKTTAEFMSKLPAAFATAFSSGTESDVSTSPPHIDLLTDGVTCVLHSTLDTVAPQKNRLRKQKTPATCYTHQILYRIANGYIDTHEVAILPIVNCLPCC